MGNADVRSKQIPISNFYCPECEHMFPLPRPYNSRKKYHRKVIFCPFCKKKQDMLEIRACDIKEDIIYAFKCRV